MGPPDSRFRPQQASRIEGGGAACQRRRDHVDARRCPSGRSPPTTSSSATAKGPWPSPASWVAPTAKSKTTPRTCSSSAPTSTRVRFDARRVASASTPIRAIASNAVSTRRRSRAFWPAPPRSSPSSAVAQRRPRRSIPFRVPFTPNTITLRPSRASQLLGSTVDAEESEGVLEAIGCRITDKSNAAITVEAPSWRPDLGREVDLIEEVGPRSRLRPRSRPPSRVCTPPRAERPSFSASSPPFGGPR